MAHFKRRDQGHANQYAGFTLVGNKSAVALVFPNARAVFLSVLQNADPNQTMLQTRSEKTGKTGNNRNELC